jgi:hypothetical protein
MLSPTSCMVPYLDGLGILAEGLLMLWLLILGVNPHPWHATPIRWEELLPGGRLRQCSRGPPKQEGI